MVKKKVFGDRHGRMLWTLGSWMLTMNGAGHKPYFQCSRLTTPLGMWVGGQVGGWAGMQ